MKRWAIILAAWLGLAGVACADVTFQSIGTNGSGSGTSTSTNAPSGVTSGDLLILDVSIEAASGTITTPSGWNLIGTAVETGVADSRVSSFWRIATGGGDDTPTVSHTSVAAGGSKTYIRRYTGHDPTTPIQTSSGANTTGTTLAIPVISVSRNGSMSSVAATNWGGAGNDLDVTYPGGYTTSSAVGNNSLVVARKAVNSGNTATENATISSSGRFALLHSVIQPPASSSPKISPTLLNSVIQ